ncbi:MAG: amino acid-binding protein, partial [Treponema sp.]|nr:amino acid-binding protein [Treponema sp.]
TLVAAVEIEDKPGSLDALLRLYEKSGINIEYLYASLEGSDGKAVVIFKLEDHEKGSEILEKNGLIMAEKF